MNPWLNNPDTTGEDPTAHWQARAACAGQAPVFDAAADGNKAAITTALAICGTCPVRAECADYAHSIRKYGVWAGIAYRDNGETRTANYPTGPRLQPRPGPPANAKLTTDQVRAIRDRGQTSDSHATIATDYGISATQVAKIIRGEAWRHIA